jgi:hypothetical protein
MSRHIYSTGTLIVKRDKSMRWFFGLFVLTGIESIDLTFGPHHGRTRFSSFSALGEYARCGFASSSTMQKAFVYYKT